MMAAEESGGCRTAEGMKWFSKIDGTLKGREEVREGRSGKATHTGRKLTLRVRDGDEDGGIASGSPAVVVEAL